MHNPSSVTRHAAPIWRDPVALSVYLIGCVTFSLGADFFIYAELGTDPLDVFSLGLVSKVSFLTIGIAQGAFAATCLAVWSIWNRCRPIVSPFVTFVFCGTLIDVFIGKKIRHGENIASHVPLHSWPLMLAGVLLCACGSSLIIMSGIGIRSMDLVAITMRDRLRMPFWLAKGVLEVMLLATGWALGGPVGWGTVCFLAFVGWLIQPLMWANGRLLRLPNRGLSGARASRDQTTRRPPSTAQHALATVSARSMAEAER